METIVQKLEYIAKQGTCSKKKVGCLVVGPAGDEIVTAANGRPGASRCADGHCYRCEASQEFVHGRDHDLCSCLHAEQAAITQAARKGIRLEGATLYSTYQPCLTCLKLIVGAGLVEVRFIEPWIIPTVVEVPNLANDYHSLIELMPAGMSPINRD